VPQIPGTLIWVVGAFLFLLFLMVVLRATLSIYRVVSPNRALVISGRNKFRVVAGGGTFIVPIIERAEELDLTIQTIDIDVVNVPTKNAVPVTVEAVAQVQVGSDEGMLQAAAERLLGKSQSPRKTSVRSPSRRLPVTSGQFWGP
jgi:flotillin